jgi:ribosomal protein S18 acetylase RimI-like enzyme
MGTTADDIVVRPLGPKDLALLCATPPEVFGDDVIPDEAAAFLADPENVVVVGLDRGAICGMATGTVLRHPDKPPQMFVNEVGVHEDRQRRGIGRALLATELAEARARGCSQVWVVTEAENAAARALYSGAEIDAVVRYDRDLADG